MVNTSNERPAKVAILYCRTAVTIDLPVKILGSAVGCAQEPYTHEAYAF